jgi:hypothetical protein
MEYYYLTQVATYFLPATVRGASASADTAVSNRWGYG